MSPSSSVDMSSTAQKGCVLCLRLVVLHVNQQVETITPNPRSSAPPQYCHLSSHFWSTPKGPLESLVISHESHESLLARTLRNEVPTTNDFGADDSCATTVLDDAVEWSECPNSSSAIA